MSDRMKERHTSRNRYIEIVIGIPGKSELTYKIPNTVSAKQHLQNFLQKLGVTDEKTPWDSLADERIQRHSKVGLALRGARYRLGFSQKKLAELCGISQENLSKMENGKRVIGEKVARKLAKVLQIDHRLLQD